MRLARFVLASAGLFGSCEPPAAAATGLVSGIYENLMLAVAPDGEMQGFYSEVQGEGVTKTCSFFLEGRAGQAATVPVMTWNRKSFPGTLAAASEGVMLAVPSGQQHPGCPLVLLPAIARGMSLDLTRRTTWLELDTITAERAYLHPVPNDTAPTRAYVVKGDVVGLLGHSGGRLQVEYVREDGTSTPGWIGKDEAAPLKRIASDRP